MSLIEFIKCLLDIKSPSKIVLSDEVDLVKIVEGKADEIQNNMDAINIDIYNNNSNDSRL